MRKLVLLMAAIFLFTGTTAVTATADELKLAVFSMREVAMKCQAFKDARDKAEKEFGKERKAIEDEETALQKKFDDYSKQQATMTAQQRDEAQMKLVSEKRAHDDKKALFMRKVGTLENKSAEQIGRLILVAANNYGKDNKYSLIMDADSAGVVHAIPSMDITQDILTAADKLYKENPKVMTETAPIVTGKPTDGKSGKK